MSPHFSLLSREQSLLVDLRYERRRPAPNLSDCSTRAGHTRVNAKSHQTSLVQEREAGVDPPRSPSIRLGQRRSVSVGIDPPRPAVLPWLLPAPSRREKADRARTLAMSRGGWGPHTHNERRRWWSPSPRVSAMARRKLQTAKCGGRRKDVGGRVDEERDIKRANN